MAKPLRKEFIGGPLDGMVAPREAVDSNKGSVAAKISETRYAIYIRRFDGNFAYLETLTDEQISTINGEELPPCKH
jgi:hypothetical protein